MSESANELYAINKIYRIINRMSKQNKEEKENIVLYIKKNEKCSSSHEIWNGVSMRRTHPAVFLYS